MDKFFLLTYTANGYDGMRHSYHSWFENEDAMKEFVENERKAGKDIEVDLAVEILSHREILI